MNRAPAVRKLPLVAFSALAVAGASSLTGGGCSLNTTGINDPGPPTTERGTGGDTTPIRTGTGGVTDAGSNATGAGGASGLGGSLGGAGGAPDTQGAGGSGLGTGGASGGTGGSASGTGGAPSNGVGGAPGIGGAGLGGMGVGGMGTGGRGVGGMGVGGMGVGGMGTGGNVVLASGCADGTREAFTNIPMFPAIAGCSGGWSVAGVVTIASNTAMCARAAGNDGARPNGNGCSIEDLCAAGWHVCRGASELTALNVRCSDARIPPVGGPVGMGPLFFATRQRGVQGTTCNADDILGTNDVHGCGNFGLLEDPNCAPLDRQLSHTECDLNAPWACGNNNTGTTEGLLVTKPGPAAGGVLCCH